MPSAVLSDGKSVVNFANEAQREAAVAHGEQMMTRDYGERAYQQGAPITAGDYIYSPSGRHANNAWGATSAWLDTHGQITDPKTGEYSPGGGALARVASTGIYAIPYAGQAAALYDLGASGYNAAKDYLAPSLGRSYEAPTVLGAVRSAAGIPEQPADESETGRILEAAASGFRPGSWGQTIKGLAQSGAVQAAGDYGGSKAEQWFGQNAGPLGRFLTSVATGTGIPTKLAQKGVANIVGRSPQTTQTAQDIALTGVTPNIQLYAGEGVRSMLKFLENIPGGGASLAGPMARTKADIAAGQSQIGQTLRGGATPVRPGGSDKESIGQDVQEAARQGAANAENQANNAMTNFTRSINDAPVDLFTPNLAISARKPGMTASTRDAVYPRQVLMDRDVQAAQSPQTQTYYGRSFPPGTVPFSVARAQRADLAEDIPNERSLPGGEQKQIYSDITAQMRNAAGALAPSFDATDMLYGARSRSRKDLEDVGGKPVQGYGQFHVPGASNTPAAPIAGAEYTGGKNTAGAHDWLQGGMQGSDRLTNFFDPTITPPDIAHSAAGKYIQSLGYTPSGNWRPDIFGRDVLHPEQGLSEGALQQIFNSPGGVPADLDRLGALARLGMRTSVAPERMGLSKAGAAAYTGIKAVEAARDVGGGLAEAAGAKEGGWISDLSKLAGFTGAPYALGKFLNAPGTLNEVAGTPSWTIAQQMFGGAPSDWANNSAFFAPKAAVANQDVQGWPNLIPAHQMSQPNANTVPVPQNQAQAAPPPGPAQAAPAPVTSDDLARRLFQFSAIPGLQ